MIRKVELDEILNNKTSKDYHIICQASMGFTTLGTLTLDFPMRESLYEFIDQVNRKNEIGSLFPRYNISCFRPPDDIEKEEAEYYSKFICDALMLHKLHVKSKNIAFIFDSYGMQMNEALAVKSLLEVFENKFKIDFNYEVLYATY